MRQRSIAALFFIASLIIVVGLLVPVAQQVPATITAADHGSTVEFSVDDVTSLTSDDCVTTRWHVEQIKAVEIDSDGVAGEGSRDACDPTVEMDVTFQDGAKATYTIPRQILTTNPVSLVLIVLALVALGLGLKISGLADALWKRIRRSAPGRTVGARLSAMPDQNDLPRPLVLFVLVAILLIGTAVRTHYLSRYLSSDESWTVVDFATEPLDVIAQDYRAPNNHIFHTLLVHESIELFGLHIWTVRLPAYFAGILIIAAAFAVGRRFYNTYVGLLSAAISASANWIVGYSVNARGYSISTLVFLLMLLVAFSLLRRRRLRHWLAFAALGVIGLYTVPTTAYAIGLVGTWMGLSILIEKRGRQRILWLRDLILTGALIGIVTGLLYFPAIRGVQTFSGSQDLKLRNLSPIDRSASGAMYSSLAGQIWERINTPWTVLVPLLAIGALIAILFHSRMSRYRVSLIAALVLWVPPAIVIPSLTTYPRVWLFLGPLYWIVAGAGLIYAVWCIVPRTFVVRPRLISGAVLLLTALLAFNMLKNVTTDTVDELGRLSVDEAIPLINAAIQPGDSAVCNWFCPAFVLEGYMHGLTLYSPITYIDTLSGDTSFTLAPGRHLYFITRDLDPVPRGQLEKALQQLKIPADALIAADVFAHLSDTTIYRLEFSRAFSAPAGDQQHILGT